MNLFIATGRLTKDPEYMESKDGKPYCRFSIACKRGYSKGKDNNVDFFDCTAFSSTADLIAKYCKKGSQVALQGSLEISSYTDRNGVARKSPSFKVREVEFLSSASAKSEHEEHDGYGKNPFDDNDGNGSFTAPKGKGKQGSMFEQSLDDDSDMIPF